jgi:hypothetical protein
MDNKSYITTFYNKWHVHYKALIDAGGKLNELDQIEIFLASLPIAKYLAIKAQFDLSEYIVSISGEKQKNPLTLTEILDRIKMFDLVSNGHADKKESNDEIYFTKNNSKDDKQKSTNSSAKSSEKFNSKLICFNCGVYGHRPQQCGSLKRPKDFCPDHLHAIMAERSKKPKTSTSIALSSQTHTSFDSL